MKKSPSEVFGTTEKVVLSEKKAKRIMTKATAKICDAGDLWGIDGWEEDLASAMGKLIYRRNNLDSALDLEEKFATKIVSLVRKQYKI
jgi:hypothetical protein